MLPSISSMWWYMLAAYLAIYLILSFVFLKRLRLKSGRKRFFRGVVSIVNRDPDDKSCILQINMIFKKLTEQYTPLAERYNSSLDILEELITIYDTSGPKQLALESFGLKLSSDVSNRLLLIRNSMKEQQPFSSIPPKEANLLTMIKTAMTENNEELGLNTLNQLADEIEIMEGKSKSTKKT